MGITYASPKIIELLLVKLQVQSQTITLIKLNLKKNEAHLVTDVD